MTDPRQDAVQRLLDTNRLLFDSPVAPPIAWARDLAQARIEAEALRARLHAIETSTSWRLTRPLRHLLQRLKPAPPPPPPPPPQPPSPPPTAEDAYPAWIAGVEPARRAALRHAGPGQGGAARPVSLGLVLLAASPGSCPPHPLPPGVRPLVPPPGLPPADSVAHALATLDAEWLCILDARDRLAPDALTLIAAALAYQDPDLLFGDEDWLDPDGRRTRPFFKPGWDSTLQQGRDLVGPCAVLRTALVRAATVAPGPAWHYDLVNQVAARARPGAIRHLPAILCHRAAPPPPPAALAEAAAHHLRRSGIAAQVQPAPIGNRVAYALPDPPPLVSIVVPTRNGAGLLRTCAHGVLHHTSYPALELLIVDNGSTEADALALLDTLAADPRVRVLRRPGPFNWSALNNHAAAHARGTVLLLLNNDIAVLNPGWLTELVAQLAQPGIGAAGAKLLYPGGTIQHAGLTTAIDGVPRHLFRHAPGDSPGLCGLMGLARSVWAVTGACLALHAALFAEAGGLNERQRVAYSDVDLCLRLLARGHRIVWTPWSVLEHREMATRPPDHAPERQAETQQELDCLRRDWGALALFDPWLNPNLAGSPDPPRLRTEP